MGTCKLVVGLLAFWVVTLQASFIQAASLEEMTATAISMNGMLSGDGGSIMSSMGFNSGSYAAVTSGASISASSVSSIGSPQPIVATVSPAKIIVPSGDIVGSLNAVFSGQTVIKQGQMITISEGQSPISLKAATDIVKVGESTMKGIFVGQDPAGKTSVYSGSLAVNAEGNVNIKMAGLTASSAGVEFDKVQPGQNSFSVQSKSDGSVKISFAAEAVNKDLVRNGAMGLGSDNHLYVFYGGKGYQLQPSAESSGSGPSIAELKVAFALKEASDLKEGKNTPMVASLQPLPVQAGYTTQNTVTGANSIAYGSKFVSYFVGNTLQINRLDSTGNDLLSPGVDIWGNPVTLSAMVYVQRPGDSEPVAMAARSNSNGQILSVNLSDLPGAGKEPITVIGVSYEQTRFNYQLNQNESVAFSVAEGS